MVHILRDSCYSGVIGVDDSVAVTTYWEDLEGFHTEDPLHTSFEDGSFDVVTCFDGSRTEDHSSLFDEMIRLSSKAILFRPDSERNYSLHESTLRLILRKGLRLVKHNPVHGWYQIEVT